MYKSLLRIATALLIPCLLVDPSTAFSMTLIQPFASLEFNLPVFTTQALELAALMQQQPIHPSASSSEMRSAGQFLKESIQKSDPTASLPTSQGSGIRLVNLATYTQFSKSEEGIIYRNPAGTDCVKIFKNPSVLKEFLDVFVKVVHAIRQKDPVLARSLSADYQVVEILGDGYGLQRTFVGGTNLQSIPASRNETLRLMAQNIEDRIDQATQQLIGTKLANRNWRILGETTFENFIVTDSESNQLRDIDPIFLDALVETASLMLLTAWKGQYIHRVTVAKYCHVSGSSDSDSVKTLEWLTTLGWLIHVSVDSSHGSPRQFRFTKEGVRVVRLLLNRAAVPSKPKHTGGAWSPDPNYKPKIWRETPIAFLVAASLAVLFHLSGSDGNLVWAEATSWFAAPLSYWLFHIPNNRPILFSQDVQELTTLKAVAAVLTFGLTLAGLPFWVVISIASTACALITNDHLYFHKRMTLQADAGPAALARAA